MKIQLHRSPFLLTRDRAEGRKLAIGLAHIVAVQPDETGCTVTLATGVQVTVVHSFEEICEAISYELPEDYPSAFAGETESGTI